MFKSHLCSPSYFYKATYIHQMSKYTYLPVFQYHGWHGNDLEDYECCSQKKMQSESTVDPTIIRSMEDVISGH